MEQRCFFQHVPLKGNLSFVPLDSFLPWSAYNEALRSIPEGNMRGVMRVAAIGNPLADVYSMFAHSKAEGPLIDPFTGRPVYNPLDSTYMKVLKTMGNIGSNLFLPTFASPQGTLGKAWSLVSDVNNKRDISPSDLALSMVGINRVPLDPKKQKDLRDTAIAGLDRTWNLYLAHGPDTTSEEYRRKQEEYSSTRYALKHGGGIGGPRGITPEQMAIWTQDPEMYETAKEKSKMTTDEMLDHLSGLREDQFGVLDAPEIGRHPKKEYFRNMSVGTLEKALREIQRNKTKRPKPLRKELEERLY